MEGGFQLAAAVAEEFLEQVVAVLEVVGYAGVGHAHSGGYSPDLYCGCAALGEEGGGGVEDLEACLFGGSPDARGGHGGTLP